MNDFAIIPKIAAAAVLLAFSAFFSGSETALFSLDALQRRSLAGRGGSRRRLVALLSNPSDILSTLLIGNTLVNVVLASLGYSIARSLGLGGAFAPLVSLVATTVVILLFGEITPKRLAMRRPAPIAAAAAAPLCFLHAALTPLRIVLKAATRGMTPFLKPEKRPLTEEELVTAIELSNEEGTIDAYERRFASGIMQLSSMTAADVMTPRVDISGIDTDEPPESYPAIIRSTRFRYLPVFENTPDSIEGFLDVKAYLLDPARGFEAALRKPVFVPETSSLDDILVTMQRSGRRIVCVIDEYGGVAGIVTRGDILEVIAGPLPENFDEPPRDPVESVGPNKWRIDGDASLELVNLATGLELESDGADRLSGWIVENAGRFLRTGESVKAQGCSAKVLRHRKLRIIDVELTILPDGDEGGDDDVGDGRADDARGSDGGVPA